MSPFLIFAGTFLPLFALAAWFHKRLRDAVAERHPSALHSIDSMTRSAPRSRRVRDRVTRFRMLQDPEIDRHIRNLSHMEIVIQCAMFAFVALFLVIVVIGTAQQ